MPNDPTKTNNGTPGRAENAGSPSMNKDQFRSLIASVDGLTPSRMRLTRWIIDHLDSDNRLIMTQREIAKKSGASLNTVIKTLHALRTPSTPGSPAFIQKISSGAYQVYPEAFLGKSQPQEAEGEQEACLPASHSNEKIEQQKEEKMKNTFPGCDASGGMDIFPHGPLTPEDFQEYQAMAQDKPNPCSTTDPTPHPIITKKRGNTMPRTHDEYKVPVHLSIFTVPCNEDTDDHNGCMASHSGPLKLPDSMRHPAITKNGNVATSYVHGLLVQNSIILASESRSIIINEKPDNYSDGFQKIVYLPKLEVGIVTAGSNMVAGQPICDFLLDQDREKEEFKDVEDRFRYIARMFPDRMESGAMINLACGGFDHGLARLLYTDVAYGKDVVIHNTDMFWHAGGAAFTLFECRDGELAANIPTIKDALDFSDFLVQAEINLDRFTPGFPMTGGPIQTLLLDRFGAKWIHKLY